MGNGTKICKTLGLCVALFASAIAGGALSANAEEPRSEKSLTKCLNSLDFYDATEFPPLRKAGKHPIVPANDAVGRKGFYVYSEDKDGADFYPLPPFSTKPSPYSPTILEQTKEHTGYYFELKVGDGPVIPLEYWDPRHPGEKAKVEEVYPGAGKLSGSPLTPVQLHGGGRDAVNAQSNSVLLRAAQDRLSHLADNYRKVIKKLGEKNRIAASGSLGIMVNETEPMKRRLAEMDKNLARDQVDPYGNRESVASLKRQRAELAQEIAGKERALAGPLARYNSNRSGLFQTRALTAAAIENCKIGPIQGLARQVEGDLDRDSYYRSKGATTGTSPTASGGTESASSGSAK